MWSLSLCRNIPAQSCLIMCSPGLSCYEYVISHEIVVWILFGFFVAKFFG